MNSVFLLVHFSPIRDVRKKSDFESSSSGAGVPTPGIF